MRRLILFHTFGQNQGNCFPLRPLFMLSYTSCFLAQAACFLKTPGTEIGILLARVKNLNPSFLLQNRGIEQKQAKLIQHSHGTFSPRSA